MTLSVLLNNLPSLAVSCLLHPRDLLISSLIHFLGMLSLIFSTQFNYLVGQVLPSFLIRFQSSYYSLTDFTCLVLHFFKLLFLFYFCFSTLGNYFHDADSALVSSHSDFILLVLHTSVRPEGEKLRPQLFPLFFSTSQCSSGP